MGTGVDGRDVIADGERKGKRGGWAGVCKDHFMTGVT